jgi:quinol-cytochrome oxidoreductase complex cytochrome b subunit
MAVVLVLIQLATGTLLKFVYAPSPALAYASITALNDQVLFGKLIRNIHFWSANALVLITFLHLLRTFFTGAFHGPRRFTWVIGLGLFCLILASNFTGYLLPWDQLAFWAVTICAGMLDYLPGLGALLQDMIKTEPEINAATLKIFYSFHTTVIPALIIIVMSFHFWRVRKDGGISHPL